MTEHEQMERWVFRSVVAGLAAWGSVFVVGFKIPLVAGVLVATAVALLMSGAIIGSLMWTRDLPVDG